MMARPVADFDGATTQLLLPSVASGFSSTATRMSAPAAAARIASFVMRTFCVARLNTASRSAGRHGSSPSGIVGSHGGVSPKRTWSDFRSALQATAARATSLVRLRVRPWLRMRTTSSGRHLAGA
jgi:hypothetical protein